MPVIVIALYDRAFDKTLSNMEEKKIILMTDAKGAKGSGQRTDRHAHAASDMAATGEPPCRCSSSPIRAAADPPTSISGAISRNRSRWSSAYARHRPELRPNNASQMHVGADRSADPPRVCNHLTGLVVAGPLAVTIWMTTLVVHHVGGWLGAPAHSADDRRKSIPPVAHPRSGLVVAFFALTLLGLCR